MDDIDLIVLLKCAECDIADLLGTASDVGHPAHTTLGELRAAIDLLKSLL